MSRIKKHELNRSQSLHGGTYAGDPEWGSTKSLSRQSFSSDSQVLAVC